MKYFIDTEFIEGFHKPTFGKRRHFIDLISIGIVAEDGREYYAISNEFNANDADKWVKENVLKQLPSNSEKKYKSNKQIADEIIDFCKYGSWNEVKTNGVTINMGQLISRTEPEFYGYYSDYDWVVFCSLFGRMIDLPNGFPMYCKDLKQMLDEKAAVYEDRFMSGKEDFKTRLDYVKAKNSYPKQTNEHNALDDAKWNFELYKFIQGL